MGLKRTGERPFDFAQRIALGFTQDEPLAGHQTSPLCRVLLGFEPAYAGGVLLMSFALALAYRVPHRSSNP